METVEVVIKISKEDYEYVKEIVQKEEYALSNFYYTIANGTVLPKGHGRLVILDEELAKKYFTAFSFSCQKWISEVGISNAILKVIEADREVENADSN